MLIFGETRAFHPVTPRLPNVHRIATLGDSMTYGAAAPPAETFASHLEPILNAAFLGEFFETVNFGRNGSNLWNAWSSFQYHYARHGFDAVVISVCDNDTCLFDGAAVEYDDYPWQGTLQYRFLVDCLAQIKRYCEQHGMLPILNFYTFVSDNLAAIELTRQASQVAAIPFVDMRSFLVDELGEDVNQLVASPLDGHPSGRTHALAARRIADEMVRLGRFGRTTGGIDIAAETRRLTADMHRQGRPAEQCLEWGSRVLDAKTRSFHRRRGRAEDITLGDVAATKAWLGQRCGIWLRRVALAGWNEMLEEVQRDQWWRNLQSYSARLRDLDELMYAVEYVEDIDQMREMVDLLRSSVWIKQHDIGPENLAAEDLRQFKASAESLLSAIIGGAGEGLIGDAVPPAVAVFLQLSEHVLRHVDSLLGLFDAGAADDRDAVRTQLLQIAGWLLRQCCTRFAFFHGALAPLVSAIPDGPLFYTEIAVEIEARSGSDDNEPRTFLYVTADYRQPLRRRVVERQLCGYEKRRWIYKFLMPVFVLADVEIEVPSTAPAYQRFVDGDIGISRVWVRNGVAADGSTGDDAMRWSSDGGASGPLLRIREIRPWSGPSA